MKACSAPMEAFDSKEREIQMLTKKMIACIYLYQKRAVAGIQYRSELSPDPVALA